LKSDDADEGVDAATDETPTRGVRITGAVPVDGLAQLPDDAAAPLPMSDLPHWGDPPTGQLPAVMSSDDNPAAVPGPTWREDKADWDYEDQTFEPAMLADEASAVSSVEDREARQPWEFDAPSPATVATEGFSADAYEAIPTEEELFAGLGALSAAGASTGADDAPRTIRRRRKRADRTDEPTMLDAASASSDVPADADADADAVDGIEDADEPPRRAIPRVERRKLAEDDSFSERVDRRNIRQRDLPPARPRAERPAERNLTVAVATGFALGVALLVALDLGTVITGLAVAAVALTAVAEGYAMFRSVGYHPATFPGVVASALALWGGYNYGQSAVAASFVIVVAGSFAWFILGPDRSDPITGMGVTLIVFAWITTCGTYGEMLLNPQMFPDRHGVALLLGLVLVTMANDTGALFIGQRLGRRPIAPTLSPNKTLEGLLGGTVCTLVMSILVANIHPWTYGSAFKLAIMCSIVAPLGDLAQSSIKRTLGLKDSGTTLPGHGGMLDRVDGLLFMLPATFFLAQSLHIG